MPPLPQSQRLRVVGDSIVLGARLPLARRVSTRTGWSIEETSPERITHLLSLAYDCDASPGSSLLGAYRYARSMLKTDPAVADKVLSWMGEPVYAVDMMPAEATSGKQRKQLVDLCIFLLRSLSNPNQAPLMTGDEGAWDPEKHPRRDDGTSQAGWFTFQTDKSGGAFVPTSPRPQIVLASAPGKDPTVEKKEKFVDRFYQDAQKAANELGVPVENILGICALESGWGGADPNARIAREGNNFFSQYHPAPYETGWIWNDDHTVKLATFSSVSDSVKSFVAQYGHLVKGKTDPEKFAAALQDAGKYGIKPSDGSKVKSFVSDVSATIRNLRPVIKRRIPSL